GRPATWAVPGRPAPVLAEGPAERPSTAITRRSVIARPTRFWYMSAIVWLTRLDSTLRRYGRKRSSSSWAWPAASLALADPVTSWLAFAVIAAGHLACGCTRNYKGVYPKDPVPRRGAIRKPS